MNNVFLSLGSNRGNRLENLQHALSILEEKAGKVARVSSFYETQPWKMEDDSPFMNQVIVLKTPFNPLELMEIIMQTETQLGRLRTIKGYEPRTMDIDILFFNNDLYNSPALTIPHPLISERRFVLEPLCEIAPDYTHPVLKKTIKQLFSECTDAYSVVRFL